MNSIIARDRVVSIMKGHNPSAIVYHDKYSSIDFMVRGISNEKLKELAIEFGTDDITIDARSEFKILIQIKGVRR